MRVYLNAIARGDDDTARAELTSPYAGPLAEEGVVDARTRIGRVDVRGSGDVVTVDVDLQTTSGPYAARFTVTRSATGAALIDSHSIVKS